MTVLGDAWDNIGAGLRLALFLPVRRRDFRFDFAGVVPLLLATTGLVLVVSFALTEPPRRFYHYGLAQFLAVNLVVLAIALALEARAGSPFGRGSLVLPLLSALPVLWFAYQFWFQIASNWGIREFWPVDAVFVLWGYLLVVRAFKIGYGLSQARAQFLAAPLVAASLGLFWLLPYWSFWYQDWSANSAVAEGAGVNVEKTYYAQGGLLDGALSGLGSTSAVE